MIQQRSDAHVITISCPVVDEVLVCCDCLGWFPMRQVDEQKWELELRLPPGRHHLRYYGRSGVALRWLDQEAVEVSEPAFAAAAG